MNKQFYYKILAILIGATLISGTTSSQEHNDGADVLTTHQHAEGTRVEIHFSKGIKHYHPLMAIWIEDIEGNYIHPLYIAKSIAKGIFGHAEYKEGSWKLGEKRVPSALPYWSHKRNIPGPDSLFIPTPEHPLPDAYTGATPTGEFILKTIVADSVGTRFKILFEINQPWDWNEHWFNNKYPGNNEYLKSAQPALVYEANIDLNNKATEYTMQPIGHSHPYGETGELFRDLSTLTTAMNIADQIVIKIK